MFNVCLGFLLVTGSFWIVLSNAQKADEYPRFPDTVLLTSYQAVVEINDARSNGYTKSFTEYYDKKNNQGRLDYIDDDGKSLVSLLYFRNPDKVLLSSRKNYTCVEKVPDFLKNHGLEFNGDYGIKALFAQKDAQSPIAGPQIRGIRSVLYRTIGSVSYYFSAKKNEVGGSETKYVPLRAQWLENEQNITVDVASFQATIPDSMNLFQIPEGLGCSGRKTDVKIESSDFASMDFSGEVIRVTGDGNVTNITQFDYFKDGDGRHSGCKATFWSDGTTNKGQRRFFQTTLLKDDKANFKTTITRFGTNCTTEVRSGELECLILPDGNKYSVDKLALNKGPSSDLQYLGQKRLRNYDTSVFERISSQLLIDFTQATVIITSYFFKDPDTDLSIPLRTEARFLKNYNLPGTELLFSVYTNIYNPKVGFGQIINLNDKVNLANCNRDRSTDRWLQITFPVQDRSDLLAFLASAPQVERKFRSQFVEDTKLSPLRVPTVQIDFDEDSMYITAQLLAMPNPEIHFQKKDGKALLIIDRVKTVGFLPLNDCLRKCLTDKCERVSYCGGLCAMSSFKETDETSDAKCNLYSRINNTASLMPTLDQAIRSIQDSIVNEKLLIVVEDSEGQEITKKAIADSANPVDQPFDDGSSRRFPGLVDSMDFTLNTYRFKYSKAKLGDLADGPYTFDDESKCRDLCSRLDKCQSYSFCHLSLDAGPQECVIAYVHTKDLNNRSEAMQEDYRCAIVTKTYLARFTKYEGISFPAETTAKTVQKVKSADECASHCALEESLDCLSFDFCSGPSFTPETCLLYTKHILDKTDKSASLTKGCTHYSRKYLYDFDKPKASVSRRNSDKMIFNVTADQCSKECVESINVQCYSFEMCPNSDGLGTCTIFSDKEAQNDLLDKPKCNFYSRRYFPSEETETETMYSYSLAGGIGFFMFLIGFSIGAAALFVYGYRKANRA